MSKLYFHRLLHLLNVFSIFEMVFLKSMMQKLYVCMRDAYIFLQMTAIDTEFRSYCIFFLTFEHFKSCQLLQFKFSNFTH